jgi:two-component system phosphate regulon sensor histidine kinase PhoR
MGRRPLVWHLFPAYVVVMLAALLAITVYTSRTFRDFQRNQLYESLAAQARLGAHQYGRILETRQHYALQALCDRLAEDTGAHVTLLDAQGAVVADSDEAYDETVSKADQPEVRAALDGELGMDVRPQPEDAEEGLYVAAPALVGRMPVGAVVFDVSTAALDARMDVVHRNMVMVGVGVALLAAALSYLLAWRISKPLNAIQRGAQAFARGNLGQRLAVPQTQEFASLAEALNQMAAQLSNRIQAEVEQRGQQEALLSSMVEGVLAVDSGGRIISMNEAAARLFGVGAADSQGRVLEEVIRNPALNAFVGRTLQSEEPVEEELSLSERSGTVLQGHGTMLRGANGQRLGVVVVLNDVTRLRRLEELRRDFVANVSHELRTPVTAIKGFVETLLDSPLDDPAEARHFMSIVARQADRLNAIIEDLLTLSRTEQEAERSEIALQHESLAKVLGAATELCAGAAAGKNVYLDVTCPEELSARVNAPLLEQAVVNLLDNAVKYSDPGSTVELVAEADDAETRIIVRDHGCGIPPDHLPRLFERFYRVDKARSRQLGGTGLGLAIVKHIAQTHQGTVTVESTPGEGSAFSIHLPVAGAGREQTAPLAAT